MSLGRLPRVCRHAVAMMWTKHPLLFICGVILLSFCCFAWLCYGGEEAVVTSHLWRSQRLFPVQGRVYDISNGSLETLSALLKRAEIKFVLFYAPWCGQSRRIAPEFSQTARILYQEVSFIAVNCWSGSCRENHVLDFFPKLFAYHTKFSGVEYLEEWKSWKFVQFLQDVMRPLVYIGNREQLGDFQVTHEEIVVSYFTPELLSSRNYSTYLGAALQSRGKVSKARYGLITSPRLAEIAGLMTTGQIVLQGLSKPTLVYPADRNFTSPSIAQWVEQNMSERLVIELSPNETNSKYIAGHLNRGPALILFLPLKQRKISRPLLKLLKTLAFEYHNCTCKGTNDNSTMTDSFDETLAADRTSREPKPVELGSSFYSDKVVATNPIGDKLVVGQTTTCLSMPLEYHNKNWKKGNVCDICQNCVKDCTYGDSFLLQNLKPRIVSAAARLASTCSTLRMSYYNRFATSICCSPRTIALDSPLTQTSSTTVPVDSLKDLDNELSSYINTLLGKMLKTLEPNNKENNSLFVASGTVGKDSVVVSVADGKVQVRVGQPGETPQASPNILVPQDQQVKPHKKTSLKARDKCNRTGHVTEFRDAGCRSNHSVNFFYMDSGKHWSVAERLGVLSDFANKVALVIVDLKNEAQYVLNETTVLANQTIVDFVMRFMSGSLERRLRSSPPQPSEFTSLCPPTQSCVVEVTTATFDSIVMNNSKDVILMYYAPWCGYCRGLYPVYLALARVFKHVKELVLARIDADANDLSWEFTVTEYPTFILFPAGRKDFSITYPKSKERTLEELKRFVLSHASEGSRRSYYGQNNDGCAKSRAKINNLKRQLQEAEQAVSLMDIRLDEAVKAKQVAEHKHAITAKDLLSAKITASRETERRMEMEQSNKNMLEDKISVEKKLWKDAAENVRLRAQLTTAENEIMEIQEKLYKVRQQAKKRSREKENLLSLLRKANSAGRSIRTSVGKLHQELRILRGKLKDSEVARKLSYEMQEMEKHGRQKANENSELLKEENIRLQEELAAAVSKIQTLEQSLKTEEKNKEFLEISERTARQQLEEVKQNYLKFTDKLNRLEIPKKQPVR